LFAQNRVIAALTAGAVVIPEAMADAITTPMIRWIFTSKKCHVLFCMPADSHWNLSDHIRGLVCAGIEHQGCRKSASAAQLFSRSPVVLFLTLFVVDILELFVVAQ
jgi:hypothetical protein